MLTPVLLPGGRPAGEELRGRFLAYALGWAVHRDPRGRTVVGHGGGQDGARALLYLLPEERLVIAVLANTNPGCDPYAVAERVAEEAAG
jgi:CubicO group peptidase (beta-lactamase class C family)